MRVFTVFCQKPLLRPFFQMDIHVQCTVPSIHDCKDTSLLLQMLTNFFFCSEILVSDLKMYNLTSFCFAGTKIRIINLVFSVSLKKE